MLEGEDNPTSSQTHPPCLCCFFYLVQKKLSIQHQLHKANLTEKMKANIFKYLKKMGTKIVQIDPQPPKIEPKWHQEGARTTPKTKNIIEPIKREEHPTAAPILSEKVGNMGPSWLPKSSQHQQQIDAKSDKKIEAFQNQFLKRFWWIWGGKIDASWHQHRLKIDTKYESQFFEKSCSRCSGGSISVEVGSKND